MENKEQVHESDLEIKVVPKFKYFPFKNIIQSSLVLIIIGCAYYWNSVYNETVYDDGINIHQNSYVLRGINGFKDILTKDNYDSFYRRMNATDQLNGGRYRPLPILTFALEQELLGTYRSGYYVQVNDLNHNNKLDNDKVEYFDGKNKYVNYEYNDFVDLNNDGIAQGKECYACWDLNKNFKNDFDEDLNKDGVFNEVDCQVYGSGVRHFDNIWMYLFAIILLYLVFSEYVFKNNQDMAFLSALLFLIHPLNSESVAVICRRDEILSLLFVSFTLLFSFRYLETKKISNLILSSIGLFLAMLSKEYGVVLLLLIPIGAYTLLKQEINFKKLLWPTLTFIISLILLVILKGIGLTSISFFIPGLLILIVFIILSQAIFKSHFIERNLSSLMIGLFISFIFYIILRLNAVQLFINVHDDEILNDPYLFSTGEERFCTKATIFLYYFKLLIYPATLICDYSYNSISPKHFTDLEFIVSLILNITFVIVGIRLTLKRHVVGFAILFYFLFLLIVGNILFPIGTTMNEHLIFHSTVGFVIIIGWLVIKFLDKITIGLNIKKIALNLILLILVIGFGYKVIERNKDWSNDVTLFLKDVDKAPNSVLCLGNAGARWIDLADTKEITGINIPGQDSTKFNDYNGALHISDEDVKKSGYRTKREAALNKGIKYLEHAIELHPKYVNGYLNLGLAFFKLGQEKKSLYYWKMAEMIYPKNPYLQNYYYVAGNIYKDKGNELSNKGDYKKAMEEFKLCLIIDSTNVEALNGLGGCYYYLRDAKTSKKLFRKVLSYDSNNTTATNALKSFDLIVVPKK